MARISKLDGLEIEVEPPQLIHDVFTLDHIAERFDDLAELFLNVANTQNAEEASLRLTSAADSAINMLARIGVLKLETEPHSRRFTPQQNEQTWLWLCVFFVQYDPNGVPNNPAGFSRSEKSPSGELVFITDPEHSRLRSQHHAAFSRYLADRIRDTEEAFVCTAKLLENGTIDRRPTAIMMPGPETPPKPTAERNDEPTDAEIERGRSVMSEMGAKNPSVRAFREAARNAGLKVGNAKLGTIFRRLKE